MVKSRQIISGQGSLENLKHSSGAKYLDYKNIQRFVRRFTNEIKV